MRKKEQNKNIIEVKEETQIGDIILEAGDRVEILKEEYDPVGILKRMMINRDKLDLSIYILEFLRNKGFSETDLDSFIEYLDKKVSI